MKRLVLSLLVILCCLSQTGCKRFLPARAEISEYDVVEVVGVDRCEDDPALIEVTMVSRLTGGSGGEGGGKDHITILSDTGSTLFEAQRKLKANAAKRLFFGYVDYILIGESAAKEDITKYIDLLERDHEIRKTSKVYVVKGGTAKRLLYNTSSEDRFVTEKLQSAKKEIDFISSTTQTELIDVAAMIDSNKLIIPALKYKNFEKTKIIGKMPDKNIKLDGYAVFNNYTLSGYIDASYARGYNLIVNEVGSFPVNVTDETGKLAALEVVRSQTKIKAQFKDDKIEAVTLETHVISHMPEQDSRANIMTESSVDTMSHELSVALEKDMDKVISLTQASKVDCIKLGQRLKLRYPYKWRKIESDWEKLYPELDIKVKVESHIVLTYDVQKPAGSK